MDNSSKRQHYIQQISQLDEQALSVFSKLELIKPLVWLEWQGNGGKLSFAGLSIKYGVSKRQIQGIINKCRKIVTKHGTK